MDTGTRSGVAWVGEAQSCGHQIAGWKADSAAGLKARGSCDRDCVSHLSAVYELCDTAHSLIKTCVEYYMVIARAVACYPSLLLVVTVRRSCYEKGNHYKS